MFGGALVSFLADKLTGSVGEFFKAKSVAETERVKMRMKAVSEGIPGWSDEWLILVWSLPLVAAFFPGLREQAAQGFQVLETFPEWYVGGFYTVTAAVFGIDKFIKIKGK